MALEPSTGLPLGPGRIRRPWGSAPLMSRLRGKLREPVLSVVMPVFNEAPTVEEIIRRVLAVPLRTQLIVVDDCSTDGTRDILARLQPELGFTLLLQPENRGKGLSGL